MHTSGESYLKVLEEVTSKIMNSLCDTFEVKELKISLSSYEECVTGWPWTSLGSLQRALLSYICIEGRVWLHKNVAPQYNQLVLNWLGGHFILAWIWNYYRLSTFRIGVLCPFLWYFRDKQYVNMFKYARETEITPHKHIQSHSKSMGILHLSFKMKWTSFPLHVSKQTTSF